MSREAPLLQAKGLRFSLGGAALFDDVEIALLRGECACLIGANGAGKSTLLNMLCGALEPDAGVISLTSGMRLAVVPQEPDLADAETLLHYVTAGDAVAEHEAQTALDEFALDPARSGAGLSGGEIRRAALARAFCLDADILLMDEPTNHLDIETIVKLEARLDGFRGAALIISHDRRFLERITNTTYWLRQRRVLKHPRGFAAFDAFAEQVEAEEQRAMARLETTLEAEEHWLRRGVTARRSRNEGRRRKLLALRAQRQERLALSSQRAVKIEAAAAGEAGRLILQAQGLTKRFGDRPIVDNLSLKIMRGDRVGVVGANGSGKTTVLNLLLGRLEPDQGHVKRADGLKIAHVDQARALLNDKATVWESLSPSGGDHIVVQGRTRHVAAYARDFLFSPAHLHQPTAALSGGERNRLALAVALAQPADLLVLDEPTNDLDADTLDALEDIISSFDGTVIIVSHDRAFLDSTTTQILGAIGAGQWRESPGGYADFVREHGEAWASPAPKSATRPATAAPAPSKSAPRKLSYKDARRLAELETLLPALDQEIVAIEAALADATLFRADPTRFAALTARLDAARREKDDGETEWLTLESLRESLQG